MSAEPTQRAVVTRDAQLRVFFSVDLVNGTAYKNRRPPEHDLSAGARGSWTHRFGTFFVDFNREFGEAVEEERAKSGHGDVLALPRLWKINGDELLFTELVYPDKRHRHVALATSVRAFVDLIARYDAELLSDMMGVRGCVWTAGFPLRNRIVRIYQEQSIPIIRRPHDFDTGEDLPPPAALMDYIGRDMDLGFRLASATPPGRVSCSLDVAEQLSHAPDPSHVFLVGWRRLKGILDGHPYPMLWLDNAPRPAARHPWELEDEQTPEDVRRLLTDAGRVMMTGDSLRDLAQQLRRQLPDLIEAYAFWRDIPQEHEETWRRGGAPPILEMVTDANGSTHGQSSTASASSVPTITMDDLNQLQLVLRRDPEQATRLASVLRAIAEHEAYRQWEEHEQYSRRLLRVPADIVFEHDRDHRLLESFRLVVDDVLRVKIHAIDSKVLITDGLWVSGEFRTFPWSDESELLHRACRERGWDEWATCLIDPGTGCGHNVLRYDRSPARRYGFDVNARAISYAAINRALNDAAPVCFGLNDIEQGLPPVFEQCAGERVLVVANMPFALVVKSGELPASADGGRFGYRLTLEALTRVHELERSLAPGSQLRCLVLTYTVGSKADDRWVVPQHAIDLFGADRVTWHLLDEERLWRVNGKKEQANPMPFDKLELKADCRFYVSPDADRDAIRADYRALANELRDRGWDHLAYGIVAIDVAPAG